jgi:large subunit ribosomal protein L15
MNMAGKLPKIKVKKAKRLGRGYGSGRGGHTVGRGQKGQKARNKPGVLFEGVKMKKSFIKRLPLTRGKGRLKGRGKPIIIKLSYLNMLPASSRVDIETLVKAGIVRDKDAKAYGVKILGNGEINKKLSVFVPISNASAKKIEKVGGKVIKND